MPLEFNFASISTIVGSCGAGKSHAIKYIIHCHRNYFDRIIVFSTTANFTQDYSYLKELGIKYNIFTPIDFDDKISAILQSQKKRRKKNVQRNMLVIFDDVVGEIKKEGKALKKLLTMYRHYRISIFYAIQHISQGSTTLRELSTNVIIFKQSSYQSLELVWKSFFQDIPTFKQFRKFIDSKLGNYRFCFINKVKDLRFFARVPKNF